MSSAQTLLWFFGLVIKERRGLGESDFGLIILTPYRDKRLKVIDDEPGIRILANCRNLIRTLGTLPIDDKNPEDVDTNAEDHAYDALRYGCMSRPTHPKYAERFRTFFKQNDFHAADDKFGY